MLVASLYKKPRSISEVFVLRIEWTNKKKKVNGEMKKILFFILLIFILVPLKVGADSIKYSLQGTDGKEVIYYLIQRNKEKSQNLLVLIQGSDCRSVISNQKMINNFGAAFPENDILLVEKAGLDSSSNQNGEALSDENCPMTYMQADSPNRRIEDYLLILSALKNNYQDIVLLGGSEGAIITHMIVSKADFISAAISINGGGRYFINDVIHSIKHDSPPSSIDDSIKSFKRFAEAAKNQHLPKETIVSTHGTQWWYESLSLDNQNLIKSARTPLLIIQTMNDNNVDATGFLHMMADINNPNVSYKTYEGLDHFFKDSDGNYQIVDIIKDIKNWYQLCGKKELHKK